MKRITLSDIAKECGVSVNTVSHALNNKPDISEKTKEQIRAVADRLGYIQNASASFLRSGISKTIAIIVGDISNPHFSFMIKEIESVAAEYGYTAFVLNTDENERLERQAIITAISKNVDGVIICPVQKSRDNIDFLIQSGIPFTLIGRRFSEIPTNYVVCDDMHSGYLAADYLLKKGLTSIAVINGAEHISSARERLDGIRKRFAESNQSAEYTLFTLDSPGGTHEQIMQMVASGKFEGAICFNDMLALELLCYIDEQMQLVSFDNIQTRLAMPYRFASITASKAQMSQSAVSILMKAIAGERNLQQQILPTRLSSKAK